MTEAYYWGQQEKRDSRSEFLFSRVHTVAIAIKPSTPFNKIVPNINRGTVREALLTCCSSQCIRALMGGGPE